MIITNLLVFLCPPVSKHLEGWRCASYLRCWMKASLAISPYARVVPYRPCLSLPSLCRLCLCLECLWQSANSLPRSGSEKPFRAHSPSQLWQSFLPVSTIPPVYHFTVGFIPPRCNSLFLLCHDSVDYESLVFAPPRSRQCLVHIIKYFLKKGIND